MNASVHRHLNRRKRGIRRRIENKPGVERHWPMMAASNIHYHRRQSPGHRIRRHLVVVPDPYELVDRDTIDSSGSAFLLYGRPICLPPTDHWKGNTRGINSADPSLAAIESGAPEAVQ
ncbi:MAG: hypothetical protein WKF75_06830 [Singulisphaera sp.]